MGAHHLAVVAEKDDVGVVGQPRFLQNVQNPPHIPVQVFDLGIIPGNVAAGSLFNPGNRRHIGPKLNFSRREAAAR